MKNYTYIIWFLKIFTCLCIGLTLSIDVFTAIQVHADISIISPSGLLPGEPTTDISSINIPRSETAGNFIWNIIAQLIALVAVLTILAITWAGIQMVLAIGEEEKMKKARHTMIYAFIGLIVSWLAYSLVTFITKIKLDTF